MGEETGISWTNATWNPWHGCAKVSAGCKNCYMFREKKQYGQDPTLVVRSKTKFRDPLKWVATGKAPQYCFTCSWSDFFIAQADPWRSEAWEIIRDTPQIIYQILTKRPERIQMGLPDDWREGYPNVWLGVSCENQGAVDLRVPLLIDVPAVVRFVSAEPLLGPIRLDECAPYTIMGDESNPGVMNAFNSSCFHPLTVMGAPVRLGNRSGISWVIAGGESGPGARPMHPDWVRSLRDQCQAADVSFHFKQWGEWTPGENVERNTGIVAGATWVNERWMFDSEDLSRDDGHRDDEPDLYRIGTKNSGATLDGREWQEFPKVVCS